MAASSNGVNAPQGPLKGVKVIDFSSFIAGSVGGMMLGDLGAEVIKVEPLGGDLCRFWGPFLAGESRLFQGWNRNKRSIAIDLRKDEGREVVYDLVRKADVTVENFRAGVTGRLKIDYESLKAINPKLIYCSSTAFGSKGPYSDRPGYDPLLQSMSGAAMANERFSGKVSICSVAISDYQAGNLCAQGILAALYHRERTGEGQMIETSLLQAAMAIQSHSFIQGIDTPEEGAAGIFPYKLFDTKDGQIFIAGPTNKFWAILCETLGLTELIEDERYDTNPKRVAHAETLSEILQAEMLERTTQELLDALIPKGFPCAPVLPYVDFLNDPQVEAMDMNPVLQHSKIGRVRVSGVPIHFEKTPGRIQRAAPTLGEHTDEILEELGLDSARIQALRDKGVIQAEAKVGA